MSIFFNIWKYSLLSKEFLLKNLKVLFMKKKKNYNIIKIFRNIKLILIFFYLKMIKFYLFFITWLKNLTFCYRCSMIILLGLYIYFYMTLFFEFFIDNKNYIQKKITILCYDIYLYYIKYYFLFEAFILFLYSFFLSFIFRTFLVDSDIFIVFAVTDDIDKLKKPSEEELYPYSQQYQYPKQFYLLKNFSINFSKWWCVYHNGIARFASPFLSPTIHYINYTNFLRLQVTLNDTNKLIELLTPEEFVKIIAKKEYIKNPYLLEWLYKLKYPVGVESPVNVDEFKFLRKAHLADTKKLIEEGYNKPISTYLLNKNFFYLMTCTREQLLNMEHHYFRHRLSFEYGSYFTVLNIVQNSINNANARDLWINNHFTVWLALSNILWDKPYLFDYCLMDYKMDEFNIPWIETGVTEGYDTEYINYEKLFFDHKYILNLDAANEESFKRFKGYYNKLINKESNTDILKYLNKWKKVNEESEFFINNNERFICRAQSFKMKTFFSKIYWTLAQEDFLQDYKLKDFPNNYTDLIDKDWFKSVNTDINFKIEKTLQQSLMEAYLCDTFTRWLFGLVNETGRQNDVFVPNYYTYATHADSPFNWTEKRQIKDIESLKLYYETKKLIASDISNVGAFSRGVYKGLTVSLDYFPHEEFYMTQKYTYLMWLLGNRFESSDNFNKSYILNLWAFSFNTQVENFASLGIKNFYQIPSSLMSDELFNNLSKYREMQNYMFSEIYSKDKTLVEPPQSKVNIFIPSKNPNDYYNTRFVKVFSSKSWAENFSFLNKKLYINCQKKFFLMSDVLIKEDVKIVRNISSGFAYIDLKESRKLNLRENL